MKSVKTTTKATTRRTDDCLVGVSRKPLIIAIPPNMSAAFRAQAQARDTSVYQEVLDGLRGISEMALDECDREDMPEHKQDWLYEGSEDFGGIIAPTFTDEQIARLRHAVSIIEANTDLRKVTIEELIVAGAMAVMDFSASPRKDAAEAIGEAIEVYARAGEAFARPELGTNDPLQSQSPEITRSRRAA